MVPTGASNFYTNNYIISHNDIYNKLYLISSISHQSTRVYYKSTLSTTKSSNIPISTNNVSTGLNTRPAQALVHRGGRAGQGRAPGVNEGYFKDGPISPHTGSIIAYLVSVSVASSPSVASLASQTACRLITLYWTRTNNLLLRRQTLYQLS